MSSANQPRRPERTAKDFAIEFGEYLARGAEQLLQALAIHDVLLMHIEEGEEIDQSELDEAREAVSEHRRALSSDIYEFRKRRDRALAPATTTHTPPPQPRDWPATWSAIREWRDAPTRAFAEAAVEAVNRTITSELHAQVHLDRIARAEQEERTTDREHV
ncbi:hypothetical protein LJR118_002137 [Acidovorax sp. LjRoot118]|uniref:hypothetical protein n=1 Tax=Acidovorax sp. LjRoot118 TaxID=3342256 RepID=UPI003ECEE532